MIHYLREGQTGFMPLISLIIPVYRISEPYIRKCLESLCNQTSKNFTAIIIDDGSPDCCGAICDEYSAKDSRITVIHKKNEGVSVARNTAIDVCDTEWIAFVDPDDWIETDLVECLEKAVNLYDADLFYYDYYHEFPGYTYNRQLPFYEGVISIENIERLRLAPFNYFNYKGKSVEYETNTLWNKLFKASVIKDNHIRFEPKAVKGQDVIFVCEVLQCAKSFVYLKKSLYHYRYLETSITNRYNPNAMEYNEVAFRCQAYLISKYHLSDSNIFRSIVFNQCSRQGCNSFCIIRRNSICHRYNSSTISRCYCFRNSINRCSRLSISDRANCA